MTHSGNIGGLAILLAMAYALVICLGRMSDALKVWTARRQAARRRP